MLRLTLQHDCRGVCMATRPSRLPRSRVGSGLPLRLRLTVRGMGGGHHGVEVHHGDEAANQERWQEANNYRFPLPGVPNVEVVLRHFHQTCYRSSPLWFFCLEMALVSWLLAQDEHGEHNGLRGSGRRSVTPYVHERRELYCSSLALPD
jgi:hypothetical protein